MKRILIIVNPTAARGGAGKAIDKVRRLTEAHNHENHFDFLITERSGHATELARENAEKYDVVVALGGDGTINEVVAGLMESGTPLGVIPLGTGNDFARSAGIPKDTSKALDLVCNGEVIPADLGTINGRYFVNVIGIGFDGQSNYETSQIKHLKGLLLILVAIFRSLRNWRSVPMTVTVDGESHSYPSYLIAVANGWSVGAGLKLVPHARIDSGLLHICHVGDISRLKIIVNFYRLATGTLGALKEVTFRSGREIVIESESGLPTHYDGEMLGMDLTRLELSIEPGALQVIRPSK